MSIRFSILASGSTGNAMIVESNDVTLLIDSGLSAKRVEQLMEERDTKGSELNGILITHEHADHIKGVGAIARKYDLPVYANEKTWEELNKQIGELADEKKVVMDTGSMLDFGSLKVESFGISHDAAEPVGYCFHDGEEKLSLATDLGYVSQRVKDKIGDSDVLILESNHDIEMLRIGRYPWNIKRRILSDLGHLSNDAAGEALCDLASSRTNRVYLAHLSRDHNMMDLARLTVNNILEDSGFDTKKEHQVRLMDTYYDRPTKWDRLDQK